MIQKEVTENTLLKQPLVHFKYWIRCLRGRAVSISFVASARLLHGSKTFGARPLLYRAPQASFNAVSAIA